MVQNLSGPFAPKLARSTCGLLVSVRNGVEAVAAATAGADVIDIKEPNAGALGAADETVWVEICDRLPESVPVTIALGELKEAADRPRVIPQRVLAVKAGPAGYLSAAAYFQDLQDLSLAVQRPCVVVAYADSLQASSPPVEEIAKLAAHAKASWLLIDTFTKTGNTLFDWVSRSQLQKIAAMCQSANCQLALAGSLRGDQIEAAMACDAALIAVRGAVCDGGRQGQVSGQKVAELSTKIVTLGHSRTKMKSDMNLAAHANQPFS